MMKYRTIRELLYYSPRYKKSVIVPSGFESDGATGAIDIEGPIRMVVIATGQYRMASLSWIVHDKLCEDMKWADGSPCSRWQGSNVISDILRSEGHYFRDGYWKYATYLPKVWKNLTGWLPW
jgi:hypothetical protein